MGRWFKQFEALIWAATLAVASLAFAYGTFATTLYVDTKHEGVMDVLNEIRESVRTIDQRTFDIARERKR